MAQEPIIYSDPAVTLKAKDFIVDNSQSAEYKEATDKAVSEVVAAIKLRISQSLEKTSKPTGSNKKRPRLMFPFNIMKRR